MRFRKMHGLGNDFVIFDAREQNIILTPQDMELIADRHWGVGCDQLVIMDESEKADIAAFFFNADGSESGACGNATRCVADILMRESGKKECTIEVTYGILQCRLVMDRISQWDAEPTPYVQVNMGKPKGVKDIDLSVGGLSKPVTVDMGNPHCVFFVKDLAAIQAELEQIGRTVENHEMFPNRTNVEFVEVLSECKLRQITWERGAGFTQACGSGACAVLAAAIHRSLVKQEAVITLDGGDLRLQQAESGEILMAGAVAYVFDGEFGDV